MYEVEQIVGKRINQQTNTLEYYVKWVNYPTEDNTWEPQKNLKFVKNLIQDFNKKCEIQGQLGFEFVKNFNTGPSKATQPTPAQSGAQQGGGQQGTQGGGGQGGPVEGKNGKKEEIMMDDSDQGNLDDGGLFFQEQSDQQPEQPKSDDSQKKIKPEKKPPQKPQQPKKPQQKPQQKLPPPLPPSSSSSRPPGSRPGNPMPRPPSRQPPPPPPSYSTPTSSVPSAGPSKNILQKMQESKKMPMLPPDFTINKEKYLSPAQLPMKSYEYAPSKNKNIDKNRNNRNQRPHDVAQFQLSRSSKIKEQVMAKMGIIKNSSKVVPPPPPPASYSSQQPIFQQNYFSNQYQVYNTGSPQFFPPAGSSKIPPPPPPASFSSSSYAQPVYTLPIPTYDYPLDPTPSSKMGKSQSYFDPLMPDYGEFQPFQPYNAHQTTQGPLDEINGYQLASDGAKLEVFQVLSMEKNVNGFTYLVQTNSGRKWVNRDLLLPQYCMLVLEFYQRHLTFQD